MDLRDIEIFLTLAEELHFGRTAERLHVTPARVSQSIKKQERRIGAPLFDRTTRVVRLTPAGEQLYEELSVGYRRIMHGIDAVSAAARGITGTLRVGYSIPWAGDVLLQAGRVFRDRNPGCAVQVQEIQFNDLLGPMRRGEVDLQISEFPIDEPDITAGPVVFSEPRVLIVPADHLLARQETVSLEDLAQVPLIAARQIPGSLLDFHFPRHTPDGRPIPRGPAYTYWPEVLALVAAGLGVSPAAARAADYHDRPGIAFVPFRDAPTLDYGLLWPADSRAPRFIHAFIDTVCESAGITRHDAD
ncbi:LysR family transcriptional regulator [Actinoallomurus vinaceus]|uniref:LysR family transcriptional regulator n=1 Tax=Actinoallomurus vinaceus TaxID=1080074 RepID=A0ABP8UF81_9ACTN